MRISDNLLATGCTLGLGVILLGGCTGNTTLAQPEVTSKTVVPGTPAMGGVSETRSLSGKVMETMNAGGYTYANLEKDGKTAWVALPATTLTVGQEIETLPGMQMGMFSSKSLNRTFDDIVFSSGLVTDKKMPSRTDHPPMDAQQRSTQSQNTHDTKKMSKMMGMMGTMAQPGKEMVAVSGKVVETRDAGGYTYINLEKDGKQTWAAVPTMKVTVGEEMVLEPGAVMTNFTSKSMNKTFESVVFSGGPINGK